MDIINTSLTKPELNIIYQGTESIIEVIGFNNQSNLKLLSAAGEGEKLKSNTFKIKSSYNKKDTLKVYSGYKLLYTKIFEVQKVKDLVVRVGHIQGPFTSVQELLENNMLKVYIPDCYYAFKIGIRSYEISLIRNSGETFYSEKAPGNEFGFYALEKIKKLKGGDKVVIKNAIGSGPGGATILLPEITLYIKQFH